MTTSAVFVSFCVYPLLQAEAMIKGYKTAILLIEFDIDKAFALTGQSEVAVELDNRSPQARLVLLLLHFPALRCALEAPSTP